jgi:hypothetical protein
MVRFLEVRVSEAEENLLDLKRDRVTNTEALTESFLK